MDKTNFLLSAVALVALVGAGCQGTADTGNNSNAQGEVIFSITDAATSLEDVTDVRMTVDKIEMHSTADGWITVSNDIKTFDLLALQAAGRAELAAQIKVATGTYNQINVHVQKIVVVKNGVEAIAKLPSNELKLNGIFRVNANTTTSVQLDILADQSLHLTGQGTFIFTPVIKLESRSNATVRVLSNGAVTVTGGDINSNATMGMDLKGEVKSDFKVDQKSNLEVNSSGTIELLSDKKSVIEITD